MTAPIASILAAARYLPCGRETAAQALAAGWASENDLIKSDFRQACVEDLLYPADMAVIVARQLLAQHDPQMLRWNLYSHIHHQGQPSLWSPAAYINRIIAAKQALAMNAYQGCNAGMLTVELACQLLLTQPSGYMACLSADRFNTSGFNRWRADYSIVYGDGAAGVLLGPPQRQHAIADILAIRSICAAQLEGLHRNTKPSPVGTFDPFNIRLTKKQFLSEFGGEALSRTTHAALGSLWSAMQQETGVCASDIGYLVLPHLGRALLEENYLPIFNLPHARSNLAAGLSIGHLGCADQVNGLCDLLEHAVSSGELALIVGAGAGFSWTLCLIRLK